MATVRLQLRRGTADEWDNANPTLAAGEIGIETDTNTFKFGDGSTAWNSLAYALSSTVDDYIALSTKGVANGVASLDGSGLIPLAQLPGAAALDAEVTTAITNHNNATTSVHGIANTANLVTVDANQTLTAKTIVSPSLTGTPTAPTATAGTDTTQVATTAFVQDAIELVVGAAPAALNTLAEIATSLNDNADLSGTLTTSISGKVAKSGDTMTGVLNMDTNKITSLGTPTTDYDGANKFYVDQRMAYGLGLHNDATTSVHGISDTANLVYTGDYRLIDARNPIDLSVTEGKITDLAVTTAKLADLAVNTAKLGDDSVTNAKVADDAVTTAKITDLAVTSAKIDASSVTNDKIADDAVTTAKIANSNITKDKINDAAVTEDKIGLAAVTEGKIADNAITTAKIADSAVTAGKIAAGAVETADIADYAVTGAKIADNSISQSHLSDDSVGTNEIGGLAVTTGKIADGAITTAKIADGAVTKSMVGLADVDNTADADKPVSTATQTALDAKASLAGATFTGDVEVDGSLVVDGNFTVNGTNFSASATSITIEDNMVQLAHQNASNTVDLGLVVGYNDGAAKHAGLVRDVSDAKWKLFKGVTTEPSTTVDFTQGSLDDLKVAAFEATTVTPSAGIVFSDKTQTKAGVPSLTTIKTSAVIGNMTLDNLGNEEENRDSLIPITGAFQITIDTTGNAKYAIGTSISFYQSNGTGGGFVQGSGMSVLGTPGLNLRTTYSSATITKIAATTWLLAGDLKA